MSLLLVLPEKYAMYPFGLLTPKADLCKCNGGQEGESGQPGKTGDTKEKKNVKCDENSKTPALSPVAAKKQNGGT